MPKLWIARDKDGTLSLFKYRPINYADRCWILHEEVEYGNYIELNSEDFPEITWENSPKEFELNVGSV